MLAIPDLPMPKLPIDQNRSLSGLSWSLAVRILPFFRFTMRFNGSQVALTFLVLVTHAFGAATAAGADVVPGGSGSGSGDTITTTLPPIPPSFRPKMTSSSIFLDFLLLLLFIVVVGMCIYGGLRAITEHKNK